MKKTRIPGLYRLPDGRWKVRATAICGRTGKLKEATRTLPAGAAEEEALTALVALKQELRAGVEAAPKPGKRLCVSDYAEQWLERKAARVRPSVARNYEAKLGLFILPRLGDLSVDALTRADVETWVGWAERATMKDGRPYARETIQGWWRVLRSLLQDATAELGLPRDPTDRVRPPKPRAVTRREKGTLTRSELADLLAGVKRFAPDRYAEVYLLAYTGMRAGELFALHFEDLDEKRGRILIRRSVWNGHEDATKTDDPREVAFPPPMRAVVEAHRATLRLAGRDVGRGDLVFPADNGRHRLPQSLHKPLALAATAAGIERKVSPQVLRRSFNTLLLEAGVDRIVLRSQMGHTSEEMTERYAGVPIERKQAAVVRLIGGVTTGREA